MSNLKIDFDKFDKNGLKPILKQFEKAGLSVQDIEATNKAKRDSGFLVKQATLTFASGQKLLVKAKAGGGIFQVRLNGKVLPIKAVDDMQKALDEVIGHVKGNEAAYLKQKERQAARVKVPRLKNVNTSLSAQIDATRDSIAQLQGANENLKTEIASVTRTIDEDLQPKLDDLQAKLQAERAKTESLTAQLEAMQQAA